MYISSDSNLEERSDYQVKHQKQVYFPTLFKLNQEQWHQLESQFDWEELAWGWEQRNTES